MLKFNPETLLHEPINIRKMLSRISVGLVVSLLLVFYIGFRIGQENMRGAIERPITFKNIIFGTREDRVTPKKVRAYLEHLNVKFVDVVMAQAIVESGNFKSEIFLQNNNFMGMKEATRRVTTAQGTDRGHAYYDSWQDCALDYAFYQATYLNHIKTEEEYLNYLGQHYAEDSNYVTKLKSIINKQK